MIRKTGVSPDTFDIDFAAAKRPRKRTIAEQLDTVLAGSLFTRTADPVIVDGLALGQAITAAIDTCDFADATGKPWLWNEYRIFLNRADHDGLRGIEDALGDQLRKLLSEQFVRRDASVPSVFVVRLLPDEGNAVVSGKGVLRAYRNKTVAVAPVAAGEITMRADRIASVPSISSHGQASLGGEPTDRHGAIVEFTGGTLPLPEGRRRVLGRPGGVGEDHLALPGTDQNKKISRRHAALLVHGDQVEVTREPGTNSVEVGGQALDEGRSVTVPLPTEIVLAGGQWRGTVRR